ncbi:MAG TPA: DinB family protein [Flavobacterium sp.]|uniref:DinB family protein n=1 Tax=Flavobacterium sp. TaxID=239 RepID=UPI002F3E83CD
MLIISINNSLNELINLLDQIPSSEYSNQCAALSNSTIGEHTRHIIEMFQCLENSYDSGFVNYDRRERNVLVQTDTDYAVSQIEIIQKSLNKENKKIELQQTIDGQEIYVESNYIRELLYNLEHCIHHQALIKVAVLQNPSISVGENFGVARSTIEYRKQCVQ